MTAGVIGTIIGAILGSVGLFTFIQFLITRHDKKHDGVEELKGELKSLTVCLRDERDNQYCDLKEQISELKQDVQYCKLDTTRMQMLFLMEHNQDDVRKIMQVAERYFVELEGDWYMSSLFAKFCDNHKIPRPDWFKDED